MPIGKKEFVPGCQRRPGIWSFASTWPPRTRGPKTRSPWARSRSIFSIPPAARSPRSRSPSFSSSYRPRSSSSGSSPSTTTTINCCRKSPKARSRDNRRRSRPVSSGSPYKIPIIDLRAQYAGLRSQIHQAVDEVLESQRFILGPAVDRFEEQMARYLGCKQAIGVGSGSDALLLALMALDVGPGDSVLVTPFTFFSTVSAITRLGATPLFIDIDPESYLLSAQDRKSVV